MTELIAVEKIAQWQKLKALVLDSVSSPITKRVYNMALNEFMECSSRRRGPASLRATVSAWRVSLEERRLGSSSIITRMSAIRKLAAEAADNGLLAPELAAGISRVKSVKSTGIRVGNWLSVRQAQSLLNAPDITRSGDCAIVRSSPSYSAAVSDDRNWRAGSLFRRPSALTFVTAFNRAGDPPRWRVSEGIGSSAAPATCDANCGGNGGSNSLHMCIATRSEPTWK